MYQEFLAGHFIVRKTTNHFLNIAINQDYEQNNKIGNIDGEAVGILDSPRASLKWSVAGPIICWRRLKISC